MGAQGLEDVIYEVDKGLAWICINRPHVYNAFRAQTVDELIECFNRAWVDPEVGVVALTGAGDKAFCAGGDLKERASSGSYGNSRTGKFEMVALQRTMRDIPKPVIAAVNGVAIGGGHVLHVICDLTVASRTARFGQSGPKVGSFDGGFGAAYLARVVGEKRAREIWFLCEQYSADKALEWGLVNRVVEPDELRAEVRELADRLLQMSPTALKLIKHAINSDTDSLPVVMSFDALDLLKKTDESREGAAAFAEKRPPEFRKHLG
jgi:2-ketocyclohexanecarboxyl-CoA hydrolase